MNNLPKAVTQLLPVCYLNPRLVDCKTNALPVEPPCHLHVYVGMYNLMTILLAAVLHQKIT